MLVSSLYLAYGLPDAQLRYYRVRRGEKGFWRGSAVLRYECGHPKLVFFCIDEPIICIWYVVKVKEGK